MKNLWTLHIDLVSYDPNHIDPDASVNLHISFPSEKEMNDAFVDYHANVGEQFTIPGHYTITAVTPDLSATTIKGADDDEKSSD